MPTTLLTGLPRSGTTLVCALLNEFADTLALGEPLELVRHGDRSRAVEEIAEFIAVTRRRAIGEGVAISKHVRGVVPDNWVEEPPVSSGKRRRRVLEERGEIPVSKALSPDFHLLIKHPAEFTALADLLQPRFPLYALVRHPLAVLAAWQTVEMPVHYGYMPMMECFVPGLTTRLDAIADRLMRQVTLMDHLLGVYAGFPPERILRYEDVVADPVITLAALTPHSRRPRRALKSFEPEQRYPDVDLRQLARALLTITPAIERFYPDFATSIARHLT